MIDAALSLNDIVISKLNEIYRFIDKKSFHYRTDDKEIVLHGIKDVIEVAESIKYFIGVSYGSE